jgi:hypothetical protein
VEEARQYSAVKPSLLWLFVFVPLVWMCGKRGVEGLRTGQAALFGQYCDWGPFDRSSQPKRFWFAVIWAFVVSAGSVVSAFWVVSENL